MSDSIFFSQNNLNDSIYIVNDSIVLTLDRIKIISDSNSNIVTLELHYVVIKQLTESQILVYLRHIQYSKLMLYSFNVLKLHIYPLEVLRSMVNDR